MDSVSWNEVLNMGERCESWICWERMLDMGEKIIEQERII